MDNINTIQQAVILAGGQGIRLRPLTNDKPKPMVEVSGRPFLEHLLAMLKENGIKEVILLLGYMPDKIIDHFGDGKRFGLKIKYSVTPVEEETGTRIKKAKDFLHNKFLLLYADNYWSLQLKSMYEFFSAKGGKKSGAVGTVTVYNNKDGFGEYGYQNNMLVADNGLVLKYDRSRKDPELNAVDIGFFIFKKSILDIFPEHNFSFEIEILPKLISEKKLFAYRTNDRYYPLTNVSFLPQLELYISTIYGNYQNPI